MMITMTIKLMMIEMIKMIKITMRNTFSLYSAGQTAVRELYTVDLVQPWWRFGSEGPPVRKDSTGRFLFLRAWPPLVVIFLKSDKGVHVLSPILVEVWFSGTSCKKGLNGFPFVSVTMI